METKLYSTKEMATFLKITTSGVRHRIRALRLQYVGKNKKQPLYSFEDFVKVSEFIKFSSTPERKPSKNMVFPDVIYVSQTFHIYESKLNYMI